MNIQKNIDLSTYNTFNIGGEARYFVEVDSIVSLKEAIQKARQEDWPYFIIGGGSNLLVNSEGFDGLVIKIKYREIEFLDEERVRVGAGVYAPRLLDSLINRNLSGFEWAVGIPASIGGLIYGNAGAFDCRTADNLEKVSVYLADQEKEVEFSPEELDFGYRQSVFQEKENMIITEAVFKFNKKSLEVIDQTLEKNLSYRQETQPLEWPSAGSIFKNPDDNSAGYLIDKTGLKGKQIGGAAVSEKHANFIINKGEATSDDVISLVNFIQKKVKEKFNIDLEPELKACPHNLIDEEQE